jgi:hypothetical protein
MSVSELFITNPYNIKAESITANTETIINLTTTNLTATNATLTNGASMPSAFKYVTSSQALKLSYPGETDDDITLHFFRMGNLVFVLIPSFQSTPAGTGFYTIDISALTQYKIKSQSPNQPCITVASVRTSTTDPISTPGIVFCNFVNQTLEICGGMGTEAFEKFPGAIPQGLYASIVVCYETDAS